MYTGEDTGKRMSPMGGGGVWAKRPVDVKPGKREYVNGPLLIPVHAQGSIDLVFWIHPGPSKVIYCAS